MKSIIFEGAEAEDIIMHFAKYLESCGLESIICDRDGSYPSSVIPVIRQDQKEGDGVLLINGHNGTEEIKSDMRCLVTDIFPAGIRRLKKRLDETLKSSYDLAIIRDNCHTEKNAEYIMNLLGLSCDYVYIRETKRDRKIRCCLQEGIGYRLGSLGKSMICGITALGKILLEIDPKAGKKAVGRERKWENSWYSDRDAKERIT